MTRLIASIVVNNDSSYRTHKFKEDVYLGDPLNTAKLLELMGYDEICFINANKTLINQKNEIDLNFIDLMKRACRNVRIPISVVLNVESDLFVQMLFDQGIDRIYIEISLNNTKLAYNWSDQFGKQSVGLTQSYEALKDIEEINIDTSYFCELRVYNKNLDNVAQSNHDLPQIKTISIRYQLPLVIANGLTRENLVLYNDLDYVVGLNVSSLSNSIGKSAAPFIVSNPLRLGSYI
jgi:hypothetical protein